MDGKRAATLLMQMRYLGTFASEEEAARAFDQEAIRMRGLGIELNLPHEAEAFLKQLKEEEEEAEANGTFQTLPCREFMSASAMPGTEEGLCQYNKPLALHLKAKPISILKGCDQSATLMSIVAGEAPRMRKGPRPLVSAGPDFEDRSTGLSLMTASRASKEPLLVTTIAYLLNLGGT